MRMTLVLALIATLPYQTAAAAPKNQVIAKGSGPVPGAIVCPDFRALQAAFRSFADGRGPGPGYFGCTLIAAGAIMSLEGEDQGGAPLVSALLPDGRPVRGVTLHEMVERFVPKDRKAALSSIKPAPVPAAGKTKTEVKGSMPLPALQNSPETFCADQRQCSDEEFSARLAVLEKRWGLMPGSLQEKCAASRPLPAMEQCISTQTESWLNANPNKETPWMVPPELLGQ